MGTWAELNHQIDRLTERLKAARQDREQRQKLVLDLLAGIEDRVKVQRAALDEANRKISDLEKERETLLLRVNEMVGLYDSGLNETEVVFKRIERLSEQVAADRPAGSRTDGSAVLPVAEGSVPVEGPSNALFLRDLDDRGLPARERFKDNEAIRRLYNQYQQRSADRRDDV